MIHSSTILASGMPVIFPSPRSGREISGHVRIDRDTYAAVDWDEDGAKLATCMYKGLITNPAEASEPADMPVINVQLAIGEQLALFDIAPAPALQTAPTPVSVVNIPVATHPAPPPADKEDAPSPEAIAMRLASITWQGRHCYYVRDVTYQALASERKAGFGVVDLSDRLVIMT